MASGHCEVTAVAEIALHFTGFKNVDLFSQGIYHIRARAVGERSRRAAVSMHFSELAPPPMEEVPGCTANRESVLPAHVLERTGEYCTQSFRVKYCEEEALMRSICRLRLELSLSASKPQVVAGVPVDPDPDTSGLYECEPIELELRLMHARSTTQFDAATEVERQSRHPGFLATHGPLCLVWSPSSSTSSVNPQKLARNRQIGARSQTLVERRTRRPLASLRRRMIFRNGASARVGRGVTALAFC